MIFGGNANDANINAFNDAHQKNKQRAASTQTHTHTATPCTHAHVCTGCTLPRHLPHENLRRDHCCTTNTRDRRFQVPFFHFFFFNQQILAYIRHLDESLVIEFNSPENNLYSVVKKKKNTVNFLPRDARRYTFKGGTLSTGGTHVCRCCCHEVLLLRKDSTSQLE